MSPPPLARTCLLALSILSASPLQAQEATAGGASPEQRQSEAKSRYEQGAQAYSAGRFKDAIDFFLAADALAPSAALSFNIARAYEKINDDAACLQWYRDFLRRAPEAKNAGEVAGRIVELEAVLASKGVQQLTVFSAPPGATVSVDGAPKGVTPYTGQFAPGSHALTLSLKDYADNQLVVELDAQRARDVSATLTPTVAGEAPASSSSAAAGSSQQPDRSGPRFGPWPWVTIGVGAAALGGALGFELARRSAEDEAKQDNTQVGYQEKLDKMQSHQTTARVLLAAGGTLVAVGGTLLILDLTSRSKPSSPHAALGWDCAQDGCGVDVRGRF